MYQHCLQENNQRSRRASEREDFLSPSLRSKFDKTPIDPGTSRQRRDSERSKKKTERISPAKTPQMAAKTSRKQLFTPESLSQEQPGGLREQHEKLDKRRKKKSASAEPSAPPSHSDSSLIPVGFMPKAWQHFKLDQELLLSLAFNQG